MKSENLNISCLQTDIVWQDRDANLEHLSGLITPIGVGCDLILLPETFSTAFPVDAKHYSEKREGTTMRWMLDMAQKKNAVVAGTLLLHDTDGCYNSFVWMRPDGSYSVYRKRHTFAIGGEGEPIRKGAQKAIIEIKGWRIMPLVCYDLRFPVWSRNSFNDGEFAYDILAYTANFPQSRMDAWDTLLKARAIENQAYVVAVNRVGTTPDGTCYSGHSQIVDARGKVVCSAHDGQEEILSAQLDASDLDTFRKKFPVALDWD
jgi:predicted amidohydrolase